MRLVYSEGFETLSEALKREYELKQWTRAEKQDLVKRTRRLARQQRLEQQGQKAASEISG